MKFAQEMLVDVIDELRPLFEKHWKEIAHYQDIELNPNYEAYFATERAGMLKVYTVRHEQTNNIVGYAVYVVAPALHYRQSIQAVEDIIFIDPDHRGDGKKFIEWCDEELKMLGVQVVTHHIKFSHDWSRMLEKIGYEKVEMRLSRRLDR